MPKGPEGQKRPADVIGAAIMVAKLATGEEEEAVEVKVGRKEGGKARAKALPPQARQKIAQKAARARWDKEREKTPSE